MNTVATSNPPTSFPAHLITISIGKKILMAVTGFVSFGFVTGHMLGNLQLFIGQDQINSYAEHLQALGPLLWLIRAVLLASLVVHIWFGVWLKLENWAARPISYQNKKTVAASLASRTMIWTGLVVFVFFAYHLLHYTIRVINPEYTELIDSLGRPDVYSMVILGFSNYLVSAFYLISVALVSYHLSHGVASMFQSFGLNNPRWQARLNVIAWVYVVVLFLGYASIPAGVMLKWITLPGGGL